MLSAALAFAAFATLFFERHNARDTRRLILAGTLVAGAIAVEFSLGLVAIALAVYAVSGRTEKF